MDSSKSMNNGKGLEQFDIDQSDQIREHFRNVELHQLEMGRHSMEIARRIQALRIILGIEDEDVPGNWVRAAPDVPEILIRGLPRMISQVGDPLDQAFRPQAPPNTMILGSFEGQGSMELYRVVHSSSVDLKSEEGIHMDESDSDASDGHLASRRCEWMDIGSGSTANDLASQDFFSSSRKAEEGIARATNDESDVSSDVYYDESDVSSEGVSSESDVPPSCIMSPSMEELHAMVEQEALVQEVPRLSPEASHDVEVAVAMRESIAMASPGGHNHKVRNQPYVEFQIFGVALAGAANRSSTRSTLELIHKIESNPDASPEEKAKWDHELELIHKIESNPDASPEEKAKWDHELTDLLDAANPAHQDILAEAPAGMLQMSGGGTQRQRSGASSSSIPPRAEDEIIPTPTPTTWGCLPRESIYLPRESRRSDVGGTPTTSKRSKDTLMYDIATCVNQPIDLSMENTVHYEQNSCFCEDDSQFFINMSEDSQFFNNMSEASISDSILLNQSSITAMPSEGCRVKTRQGTRSTAAASYSESPTSFSEGIAPTCVDEPLSSYIRPPLEQVEETPSLQERRKNQPKSLWPKFSKTTLSNIFKKS